MKRSATGRYIQTSSGDETVRAFVPYPLPPELSIGVDLREQLDQALLSLGRLSGSAVFLPDSKLLMYLYSDRRGGGSHAGQLVLPEPACSGEIGFRRNRRRFHACDDGADNVARSVRAERLDRGYFHRSRIFRSGVLPYP